MHFTLVDQYSDVVKKLQIFATDRSLVFICTDAVLAARFQIKNPTCDTAPLNVCWKQGYHCKHHYRIYPQQMQRSFMSRGFKDIFLLKIAQAAKTPPGKLGWRVSIRFLIGRHNKAVPFSPPVFSPHRFQIIKHTLAKPQRWKFVANKLSILTLQPDVPQKSTPLHKLGFHENIFIKDSV